MATTRFGHLDDFTHKNSKVGIGTSTPTEALEVIGGSRTKDIAVTGIASLTSYEGFQNKKTSYVDNIHVDSGESGTLSGEVVIGAGLTMSIGTGATTGQGNIESLKVSNTFTPPIGGTNDRPSAPQPGALFYNKDFRTIEYWDGNFWRQVDNTTRMGRAVIYGGHNGSSTTGNIDFINMSSQGNAVDFGTGRAGNAVDSVSSAIRMVFTTGANDPANEMEYITIASGGNGIEFGDQATYRYRMAAHSSSTRGLFMGGRAAPGTETSEIEYITISQLGNSLDFGDMHTNMRMQSSGMGSPTRAFTVLGYSAGSYRQEIQMLQIQSKGNAVDFGNGTFQGGYTAGASNSVRGFGFGGYQHPGAANYYSKEIFQLNLASQGNATEFGNLSRKCGYLTGTANGTRAFRFGGAIWTPTNYIYDDIDYWNITSAGNATDFGNLSEARYDLASSSDSHGGLGGF